MQDLSS